MENFVLPINKRERTLNVIYHKTNYLSLYLNDDIVVMFTVWNLNQNTKHVFFNMISLFRCPNGHFLTD